MTLLTPPATGTTASVRTTSMTSRSISTNAIRSCAARSSPIAASTSRAKRCTSKRCFAATRPEACSFLLPARKSMCRFTTVTTKKSTSGRSRSASGAAPNGPSKFPTTPSSARTRSEGRSRSRDWPRRAIFSSPHIGVPSFELM